MSTTLTGRLGPINRGKTQRHQKAEGSFAPFAPLAPLRAWRARSPLLFRLLVASLIAIATFAIAANAWIAADLMGTQAMRTRVDETQQRLDRAQRAVGELPALRASAGAESLVSPTRASESGASTDDVRIVSQLAARGGITLLALEPGAVTGAGIDAMRPLRMTALASFSQLLTFVRALPGLPVLIVPGELLVKRTGEPASGLLSVSATLHVFDALRRSNPLEGLNDDLMADDDEDIVFYDPFSHPLQPDARIPDSDSVGLRLVGLLYDLARGLGLVETPDGEATLEAGQRVGTDSVARVDGRGITLAARDGSEHRLMFEDTVQ
jgi:Tfp pilus assembly protein PilO